MKLQTYDSYCDDSPAPDYLADTEITPAQVAGFHCVPAGDFPGILKVIRTIREEYSRPLNVTTLARECGMSVRSLHRAYRAVTGKTVGRDLLNRRIEAAADMLREDDIKLEPVAMETGLRNAKNLCRLFKDHFGVTPGQWKESFHGSCARSA
jgi:transcriptional regulator GlxA family with amidase domain